MIKATHHYSGPNSRAFWTRIHRVHQPGTYVLWEKLCSAGCALQKHEARVLKQLEKAEARLAGGPR